jgi:hypothetical protein
MSNPCRSCGAMPRNVRHREGCPDRDAPASGAYDRGELMTTLVYHQRRNIAGCICGWSVLGASHPVHVADMYEAAMKEREAALATDDHYERDGGSTCICGEPWICPTWTEQVLANLRAPEGDRP